jgi:hypothetical protein
MSRANAEERMLKKLGHSLTEDIAPLFSPEARFTDATPIAAFGAEWQQLISRIHGDPWKSSRVVIDEIRKKIPGLLGGVED